MNKYYETHEVPECCPECGDRTEVLGWCHLCGWACDEDCNEDKEGKGLEEEGC